MLITVWWVTAFEGCWEVGVATTLTKSGSELQEGWPVAQLGDCVLAMVGSLFATKVGTNNLGITQVIDRDLQAIP